MSGEVIIDRAAPAAFFIVGLIVVNIMFWIGSRWSAGRRLIERARHQAGCTRRNERASPNQTALMEMAGVWLRKAARLVLPVIATRDREKARELLEGAGLRDPRMVIRFLGTKVAAFILSVGGCLAFIARDGQWMEHPWRYLAAVAMGGIAASLCPEMMVRLLRRRRRDRIRSALADTIDLMIITSNAGQSLDVTLTRVAREIARLAPELSDELQITIAELQALPDRRDALDNLANRTGLPEVRTLTATLIQTIRYGTPLTQALKALAHEIRQFRLIALEEKAAKLPALLSIPLMLLIMPAVFIVTAGPAVLSLIDAFSD